MSGLYSVMGAEMVETVYCDFSKLPSESSKLPVFQKPFEDCSKRYFLIANQFLDFQKWIGYTDVKTLPIYFYVQKTSGFNVTNTPIPFETERLNIGKAMNLSSGIFTAPRTGKYFFSFSGIKKSLSTNSNYIKLALLLNGGWVGKALSYNNDNYETYSLQAALNLQAGDQIWVIIDDMTGAFLYDDGQHFTHFTGWLLQEDISKSLNMI